MAAFRWTWILVWPWLWLLHPSVSALAADDALLRVLEAGHNQWLRDTVLVCRFKVFRGSPTSKEEALALPIDRMELEGEGQLVKMVEAVRLVFRPARPPARAEGEGGGEGWRDLPFDETSDGVVQIRFPIPTRALPQTVLFVETSEGKPTLPYQAGTQTASVITPLYIAGRHFTEPYSFGNMRGDDGTEQVRIAATTPELTVVEASLLMDPWTRRRNVEFWTEPSVPVIRRVTTLDTNSATGYWIESITEGRDFVECPGGPVAREVRYVLGQKERRSWKLYVWTSEDLGLREPGKEDFDIEVPKETDIRGLKQSMPGGTVRHLNILDLGTEDLTVHRAVGEIGGDTGSELRRATWWISFNAIIAVVIGLALLIHHVRRRA